MTKPEKKITERYFIHSSYNKKVDAVFVKEKVVYDDGTTGPNITVYKNPKRPIYLTKLERRNHEYKLEREHLDNLDRVDVLESRKPYEIARLLGLPQKRWYTNAMLYASPYIYGGNICIEALIKQAYAKRVGYKSVMPSVGFLDIENDIDTKEITLNTYLASSGKCYIAVLRDMMYRVVGDTRVKISDEDFEREVLEKIQGHLKPENFNEKLQKKGIPKYEFEMAFCSDATEMTRFIFKAIHDEQDDFIGTWSDHDVVTMMYNINEFTAHTPETFFCHPASSKDGVRWLNWDSGEKSMKEDSHWTHRWSWLSSTCPAQFLNLMALYSHMRKTAPFRDSYKLDDVLLEFIGTGKFAKESEDHKWMATNRFLDYTVYNIFDAIGLDLLERVNHDVTGYSEMCAKSPVKDFNRAVVTTHNDLYDYNLNLGYVLSTPSADEKYAKVHGFFPSTGGTVLPPYLYDGPALEIS